MTTTTARMAAVSLALLAAAPVTAADAKTHKKPRPDLAVTSVSKPPATSAGAGHLSITVKVRNRGKAAAKKSTVGLYLATRSKHSSKDLRLARKRVKALKKGKTAKVTVKATLPAVAAATVKAGAYRVIACADDTKKVKESNERNNCKAAPGTITLTAPPKQTPPPPPAPAAPAFTLADGIDWGFTEDASANTPNAGDPITATLTAANGKAGQAGYTRSSVPAQGLVTGPSSTLSFPNNDDGQVTQALPFPFPFGGVTESSISISTNGYVSFGGPAWDYWNDFQPTDYRGVNAVVGRFERGMMPYWADLDVSNQGSGTGTVTVVTPADHSSVAVQWDTGQHPGTGAPRRVFQLVLYPDGRFRFDYPGTNADGGSTAFVGYSLGTGATSVDPVGTNVTAVPGSSLLFTPKAVAAGQPTPAGQATLALPAGSSLVSADAGCTQTTAPAAFTPGLVTCAIPAIPAGQQLTRQIVFATPANAPGQASPPNFGLSAAFHAGSFSLADDTEVDLLNTDLESTTATVAPTYSTPATPVHDAPATFNVVVGANNGGLDQPTVTFTLPANTTLDSVKIGSDDLDCDAPASGEVHCRLPSGLGSGALARRTVAVTVTPSAAAVGNPMTLGASVQALNAPQATNSVASPNVT